MDGSLGRLGDFVSARQRALGLSREAVQAAGGPSDTRMASIERGTGPTPKPSTLAKLDRALQWEPGSAAAILDGRGPREIGTTDGPSYIGVSQVPVDADELSNLISSADRLLRIVTPTEPNEELTAAIAGVRTAVSALAGRWATDLLERNHSSDGTIPSLIDLALGHLLDEAPEGSVEPELTERQYRRFLAHRISADLPSSKLAEFENRLARRR